MSAYVHAHLRWAVPLLERGTSSASDFKAASVPLLLIATGLVASALLLFCCFGSAAFCACGDMV